MHTQKREKGKRKQCNHCNDVYLKICETQSRECPKNRSLVPPPYRCLRGCSSFPKPARDRATIKQKRTKRADGPKAARLCSVVFAVAPNFAYSASCPDSTHMLREPYHERSHRVNPDFSKSLRDNPGDPSIDCDSALPPGRNGIIIHSEMPWHSVEIPAVPRPKKALFNEDCISGFARKNSCKRWMTPITRHDKGTTTR